MVWKTIPSHHQSPAIIKISSSTTGTETKRHSANYGFCTCTRKQAVDMAVDWVLIEPNKHGKDD
jgi:hypothetical protein